MRDINAMRGSIEYYEKVTFDAMKIVRCLISSERVHLLNKRWEIMRKIELWLSRDQKLTIIYGLI